MASKLDKIRARMNDMEHQEIDTEFIGEIYGGPGAGKTVLAMKLAQELALGEPILYLDSADGWVSLKNHPELQENASLIQMDDPSDMPVITNALKTRAKGFEDFRVVVVDEFSSVAQQSLEEIVREDQGLALDELLGEYQGRNYGTMTQLMASILRNLKKVAKLHIILVSHSRDKTDNRKVTTHFPEYPPLLLNQIQKLVHVTAYATATIEERKGKISYNRQVQSQPSGLVLAKSRIGGMPVRTDFATWVDIIADWTYGELMEEGTPTEMDAPIATLADDIPPTDGLPGADTSDEEDDEPAYAE